MRACRFAQLIKFTQQRPPFHLATRTPREVVETVLRQEGKERAEHVTANGSV
jgi:hypothetical protein